MSDLPPIPPDRAPPAPGLPPRGEEPLGTGPPERPDLDRPKATWRWWEVVLVYLIGAYVLGGIATIPLIVVTDLLEDGGPTPIDGFTLVAASVIVDLTLFGAAFLWLQRFHPTWRRIMGFPSRDRWSNEIAAGSVASLVILFVSGVVGVGIRFVLEAISGRVIVQPDQVPSDLGAGGIVLTVVFACLVAPIVEEFVFRGMLFTSIRDRYGVVPGVVLSGVAFGLVHFGVNGDLLDNLLLQIPLAFVGMGFAIVYEMRKNLVAPIAAHVVFNVIGIIVILWGLP